MNYSFRKMVILTIHTTEENRVMIMVGMKAYIDK